MKFISGIITRKTILFFLLISLLPYYGFAQRTKSSLSAGEQRHAEKGLKDNRYFFYFINSSISNLGSDEEKAIFKEAIQRDIIAQLLYMKFQFHDSFLEIRKSQKLLIDLYRLTLKRDIKITRELLNGFAPRVVESGNDRARHYLKLGYRDVVHSNSDMLMGDNYRENLYSMRLYKYTRAIKMAKHGKRYAFFSLFESGIEPSAKINKWGFLSFEELEKKIVESTEDNKDYFQTIHYDNYYRARADKSFYDSIWENPLLNEIPEYSEYLKKD